MPTTFNWIYLGTTSVVLDPTEGNSNTENAAGIVGTTWGSTTVPLYTRITSATMINNGGNTGVLDTNNNVSNDQFTSNIGAGVQTFVYDGGGVYNVTITYADGTTATISGVIVQSTTGELFFAPEQSANADTVAQEAKPIVSITIGTNLINTGDFTADRATTGWDDGWVDGTAGNDLINSAYVEPISLGTDRIDNNDGITSSSVNDDRVRAGAGDDMVLAGLGNDLVYGGTGADSLSGEAGVDTIYGEDGNDRLYGGDGGDILYGGVGLDTLYGDAGADTLYGEAANDLLIGGTEADLVYGGADQDTLYGDAGNDSLYGDDGNDRLYGGDNSDLLIGGLGLDALYGDAGADILYGDAGTDTLFGGGDNDLAYGGLDADTLYGDAGADTLYGGNDGDLAFGGDGGDALFGDAGSDTLYGDTGNDLLRGGTEADLVYGGADQDTIYGDAGNDTLFGEVGNDILYGGAGSDLVYGGDDRDLISAAFADVSGSENVFGGGGGVDNDTLRVDITGFGWARIDLVYDPLNAENGTITFFAADGITVLGTLNFTDIENLVIVCFTAGTRIMTAAGPVAVEDMSPGDLVLTRDNGLQPLRWIGRRVLGPAELLARPELQPVRIGAGALGDAGPERSMMVSPQHRVLVEGARAEMYFGESEVLVPAKHLVGLAEVTRAVPEDGVIYVHILFDRHEIVLSEGIWTESFQPAERTLNALEAAARAEVLALFPELNTDATAFPAARLSLKAHEARVLISG